MKQKLLEMIQVNDWLHTDEFIFIWFYKKENGRQNWVTTTGGRHNLVPRLTTERRPPPWSAIYSKLCQSISTLPKFVRHLYINHHNFFSESSFYIQVSFERNSAPTTSRTSRTSSRWSSTKSGILINFRTDLQESLKNII